MGSSTEHRDAARIAAEAGQVLLRLKETSGSSDSDPRALGARGDRLSHDLIVDLLTRAYPGDPILSEEGRDDTRRIGSRRVWIVDPLDGTREFGEPGRIDWAVHVALIEDGQPIAAAVALPVRGLTMGMAPAAVLPPRSGDRLRIVVSRTRPPELAQQLARRLGGELIPMGSAGAKTMAVVLGEADVYVHSGGQYEWDSAAPIGVASAAGLHVSRIDGTPLQYNQPNPWLPDQLVCRPELAAAVLAAIQAAG